jgi:hypothetical protein
VDPKARRVTPQSAEKRLPRRIKFPAGWAEGCLEKFTGVGGLGLRLRLWEGNQPMRKLALAFGLAVGLLSLASPHAAQAGPMTSAQLLFALGSLPPAAFVGPGGGSATSSSAFTVASGAVPGGAFTTTLPSSAAPPLTQIQVVVSGNVPGTFTGPSGTMAVTGVANVKSYGGLTLLGIPLVMGVTTTINAGPSFGVVVTAFANDWTTGTTLIPLTTPTSQGATFAAVAGSNNLTAGGGGTITLVTGINVLTNIAGQFPAFAFLTMSFAPEPGSLLLLLAGAAGLVAVGRSKRRD